MSASQAEYAGSIPVIGSFPPVRAQAHRGFRCPEPENPPLPATLIPTITLPNPYRQAGRRDEVDVLKLKSTPGGAEGRTTKMAQQQASQQEKEQAGAQGLTRISDASNPYPVPEEYPEYQPKNDTTKGQRKLSVYTAIDALFIVVTLALTAWYLALMILNGFKIGRASCRERV